MVLAKEAQGTLRLYTVAWLPEAQRPPVHLSRQLKAAYKTPPLEAWIKPEESASSVTGSTVFCLIPPGSKVTEPILAAPGF